MSETKSTSHPLPRGPEKPAKAKFGFEMRKIRLPLDAIIPVRKVNDPKKNITRYKTILSTIKEAGLVEPLVVYPQKDKSGTYLLVDGHLRYLALRELGETAADCIFSTDDESFTYNARINRLSPIQEHKMIMKAVHNGVKPERIAAALNIPLRLVHASMNLLDGIDPEAADLLKDKAISPQTIRLLKRVTALRQIDIVEMMINASNFTAGYAEAMLLATPKEQLVRPEEPKEKKGMSPEAIAKMEEEMACLERGIKAIDKTYGENMLNFTVLRSYIKRLLDNGKVVRYLNTNHPDILSEFETIASAETV